MRCPLFQHLGMRHPGVSSDPKIGSDWRLTWEVDDPTEPQTGSDDGSMAYAVAMDTWYMKGAKGSGHRSDWVEEAIWWRELAKRRSMVEGTSLPVVPRGLSDRERERLPWAITNQSCS